MKNKRQLGIYIHIPFCVRKCDYCDFLSGPADDGVKAAYIEALKCEIAHTAGIVKDSECQAETYQVETIFFGGGTPTVVNAEFIAQLLDEIRKYFCVSPSAEITIECNPGTLTKEKADIYRGAGINRISFGLQSADDGLLMLIGRIHTWEDFKNSFEIARAAGFDNINVDIMSALPGQTLEGYVQGLEKVLKYNPEHISAYSLILEEGTPLGDNPSKYPPVPDEDTEREMYYETLRLLEACGYHRYEISNYARPGYECRHNLSYWERKDYLGFGVGAASLFEGKRISNIRSVDDYIRLMSGIDGSTQRGIGDVRSEVESKLCNEVASGMCGKVESRLCNEVASGMCGEVGSRLCNEGASELCGELERGLRSELKRGLRSEVEVLSSRDAMSEFMFLGLRKTAGVSFSDFAGQFGAGIRSIFGEAIEENVEKGLLEYVWEHGAGDSRSQDISRTAVPDITAVSDITDAPYIMAAPAGCRLTSRGIDVSNVVLADFLL